MALRSVADERVDQTILNNRAPSVAALFRDRVAKSGSSEAFQYFLGSELQHVTWGQAKDQVYTCLLYTSPSPRDGLLSRMPSSA